eukprot:c30235_g1_i1 orf=454-732(+)
MFENPLTPFLLNRAARMPEIPQPGLHTIKLLLKTMQDLCASFQSRDLIDFSIFGFQSCLIMTRLNFIYCIAVTEALCLYYCRSLKLSECPGS